MAIEYVNGRFVEVPDYRMVTAPNWSSPNARAYGNAQSNPNSVNGLWAKLAGRLGNFKLPNLKNIDTARMNFVNEPILGAQGNPSIAQVSQVGGGIYHGMKALQGLDANANADKDLDSLKRDIIAAKVSNPMYDMYMDATDERLMRQLNNDNTSDKMNAAISNTFNSIPKALINAGLGYLTGNLPGAVIQGVGTLANAGIQGYGQGTEQQQAKLQSLYNKLRRADEDYRSMKRPRGLRQAGLQNQYFNQLY